MNTATLDNPVISSDKVEGTAVYNSTGEKLGSIDDLIIDKRSGQVRYAALGIRRLSRHGHRPLSRAVEHAEVRHQQGRVCRAADEGATGSGARTIRKATTRSTATNTAARCTTTTARRGTDLTNAH